MLPPNLIWHNIFLKHDSRWVKLSTEWDGILTLQIGRLPLKERVSETLKILLRHWQKKKSGKKEELL